MNNNLYNDYLNHLIVNATPDSSYDNVTDAYIETYGVNVFLDYADIDNDIA